MTSLQANSDAFVATTGERNVPVDLISYKKHQNDLPSDSAQLQNDVADVVTTPEKTISNELPSKSGKYVKHTSKPPVPVKRLQNSDSTELAQASQKHELPTSTTTSIERDADTASVPASPASAMSLTDRRFTEETSQAKGDPKGTSFVERKDPTQEDITRQKMADKKLYGAIDNSQDEKNAEKKGSSLETAPASSSSAATKDKPGPTPRFVYILSMLATVGGFLFGYDIGIVAGSMLYIKPYFLLSTFWQEAIVSGTIAAAAVAALVSGWLTDRIGRKLTIMTSSIVFTIGGIVMGSAPTKEVLLVGRVIAGLGVGLASVVVPVYVAESAPVHIRGRLVSFHQLLINTGIIISSLIAGGFSYVVPDGWRYMLGMAALPGVVQFIGFLFMPESPRWLVGRGHIEQAKQVLLRMRGGCDVTEELNDIILTVKEAEKETAVGIHHWIKIFRTRQVRRALFVGCALLFFQQWCGINTVIYYSGTVLKMAGFPVKYAVWLVAVPNLINFLSSFIGLYLVEKIGRRLLLIISLGGTIVGLVILAVGFQLSAENEASLNTTIVERYSNGTAISKCLSVYRTCDACVKDDTCGYCYSGNDDGTCLPSLDEERSSAGRCNMSSSTETHFKWAYEYCPSDYTWVALIGMAVFVFAFAPGLGPMPWTINSEIYPLWARSTCNSLAAATAWVCNLIISFTFLTMTEHITIYGTFWLFAAITVIGVVFMVVMLPETKNKTLEEMELLFLSPKHRTELMAKKDKTQTTST